MAGRIKLLFIYFLAISIILLGMRPLLFTIAKIPQVISWNINNAEEEEEHNKNPKDNEHDKKFNGHALEDAIILAISKHFSSFYYLQIKEVHLSYPNPPPES